MTQLLNGDWRPTDPVDRFRTLVDQTMTLSVVAPPTGEEAELLGNRRTAVGSGDGTSEAAAPAQTSYGLPDVVLSDPVMLGSTVRLALAGLCGFSVLAAIGAVIGLAAVDRHGAAPYAVLGVLAGLSLVALVVLVMGYKNVTIRSGSALPAGAPR